MTLRPDDLDQRRSSYLVRLRSWSYPAAYVPKSMTSINLGNRRLRTIDELACDELRKGFLKLRRTVQERMSLKDAEDMTPRSAGESQERFGGDRVLLRAQRVVASRGPDEPACSMLTHERRLSALGPGGLNRKRAGFEVRDVHISHYGRICPIETPEGTNIGLISSLAIYAQVWTTTDFSSRRTGELTKGKLTDEIEWLRADEESLNRARRVPPIRPVKQRQAGCRPIACWLATETTSVTVDAGPASGVHRRCRSQSDGRRFGGSDSFLGA